MNRENTESFIKVDGLEIVNRAKTAVDAIVAHNKYCDEARKKHFDKLYADRLDEYTEKYESAKAYVESGDHIKDIDEIMEEYRYPETLGRKLMGIFTALDEFDWCKVEDSYNAISEKLHAKHDFWKQVTSNTLHRGFDNYRGRRAIAELKAVTFDNYYYRPGLWLMNIYRENVRFHNYYIPLPSDDMPITNPPNMVHIPDRIHALTTCPVGDMYISVSDWSALLRVEELVKKHVKKREAI